MNHKGEELPAVSPIAVAPHIHKSILGRLARIDRVVWIVLLGAAVFFFLWRNRSELDAALLQIRTANIWWLAVSLLIAAAMHAGFAFAQAELVRSVGHPIPARVALRSYVERQTMATVIPFGNVPSMALMARQFAPYGLRPSGAVVAAALYSLIGYATFALVLLPVMIGMMLRHAASGGVLAAAGGLCLVIAALTILSLRIVRGGAVPAWLDRRMPDRFRSTLSEIRAYDLRPLPVVVAVVLALAGDLLGPLCLYAALRSVGVDASFWTAATGYVVGTLFLLVAPVFQGIGIVEVSMAVALGRLGIAPGAAIGATLIYRIGDTWLPVTFGIASGAARQPRLRGVPARLPALWTALTGVLTLLALISPIRGHVVPQFRNVEFFHPDHSTLWSISLAAGLLLLYLAFGLWRRQRIAWLGAVVLSGALVIVHLQEPHDRGIAIVALANLLILLLYRERFRVRSDPPSLRVGLITLAVSLIIALGYGVGGFWLAVPRDFGEDIPIDQAVRTTFDRYLTTGSGGLQPRTRHADWFLDSLGLVEVVTVTIAGLALARPVIWRRRADARERAEAAAVIDRYGDSSLDFFKYWPDKHFYFSADRRGVVSFRTSNGVAVVLGDPVAPDEPALRALISEFVEFCDVNGWQAVFHQVPPRHLDAYHAAGLISVKIGAEAIVDLPGFTLSGNRMKNLRSVVNRYERLGYRRVWYEPPIDEHVFARLREVSDEWLTLPGRRERGFTLGQFSDAYIRGCRILAVETSEGRIEAFVNLIPDGVEHELTFDLMRHRASAPNGAMDYILIGLIEHGREQGYQRLSLGMVPFIDVGTGADARFRERVLERLTSQLHGRFFAAKSLWAYKNKFHPNWEPRYLIYGSDAALPRIGLALAHLTEESTPLPEALVTVSPAGELRHA